MKKISVQNVVFSKTNTWSEIMDIFIRIAKENPTQAEAVFNKYVEFLSYKYPDKNKQQIVKDASANIGYLVGYYNVKTRNLLYSVYKMISHPMFGRNY